MKDNTIRPVPPTKKEAFELITDILSCCIETNNTMYCGYCADHVQACLSFFDQKEYIELADAMDPNLPLLTLNANTNRMDIYIFLNHFFTELRMYGYKTR